MGMVKSVIDLRISWNHVKYYYLCLQLADAMELMLLSVLSPAVQCEWELTDDEEALITSVSEYEWLKYTSNFSCEMLSIRRTI